MGTVIDSAKAYRPPEASAIPLTDAPFVRETVAVSYALLRATHFANYIYERGARAVSTCLRLTPPARRGHQRLIADELRCAPPPHSTPRSTDEFGNTVIEIKQERVEAHQTLVVTTLVETACSYGADGAQLPMPVPADAHAGRNPDDYLSFTALTTPDNALFEAARQIQADTAQLTPLQKIKAFADFVHGRMHFSSGATGVGTSAAEAWAVRKGVCQDYTHILLTICRLNSIPARYVSGCVPGEGVMHAWVEVFVPHPSEPELSCWWPVDATYNKWVSERYISIAAGRDYRDIAPSYGSYFGGSNSLRHRSTIQIEQRHTVLSP